MANSILDIKGVHVCAGRFSFGADIDLFKAGSKPDRASVIFGRNGSGKSTIANYIAKKATADGDLDCFYDKDGCLFTLDRGGHVRVFSEEYVRDKILIDEDGIEAIVMLGE